MSEETFWLKDMIVLGQGAPNQIRKLGGQQGRCLCLWSQETGFVRVYAVPHGHVKDWDIIDVQVRYPNDDGRENSFVIYNYENEWNNLSRRIYAQKRTNKKGKMVHKQLKRNERIDLIHHIPKSTFSEIRDNKKSFGLIKPSKIEFITKKNKETTISQKTLLSLDYDIINQKDFAYIPYLRYECQGKCSSKHPHEQKIVEWGAYQWIRKLPNSEEFCKELKNNYHIDDPDYEHYILIGNIKKYTTTYIIVKLIRFKTR